jgi:hypothetical protein
LFDKAGGDSMAASSKHYAKDLRHLVMLNGFCLQESTVSQPPIPNIPIPTVPTSPQGLSPSQQQTIRPTQNVVVRPPQPQNQPQQRPPVPFGRTSFKKLPNPFIKILSFTFTYPLQELMSLDLRLRLMSRLLIRYLL